MIHARKIVTVTASDQSFELDTDGETVGIVPRTTQSFPDRVASRSWHQ
jgi:hypothetical protein